MDVAIELLDPAFAVIAKSDLESDDAHSLKKQLKQASLKQGKYLVHLYLQGRLDAAEVELAPAQRNHGKLVEELWEHHVGAHLHAPTFVRDFPVETSPLTRDHRSKPGLVEKWDLYVRGLELATAYSELVDPVIQRQRFEAQALLAARGDDEAMRIDEDFLTAMEFAMPPSGGMGMGIDRLLIAMTGQGIRDTILFPLVKPLS